MNEFFLPSTVIKKEYLDKIVFFGDDFDDTIHSQY